MTDEEDFSDVPNLRGRIDFLQAQNAELQAEGQRLKYDPCCVCAGSGKLLTDEPCGICKGTGSGAEEKVGLRMEAQRLERRGAELERKGDADRELLNEWEAERLKLKARVDDLKTQREALLYYARARCRCIYSELAGVEAARPIKECVDSLEYERGREDARREPIPMLLFCPACSHMHIDAPNPEIGWTDPPHKSHECQNPACKHVWRPADVPTTGVSNLKTRGQRDGSAVPQVLLPPPPAVLAEAERLLQAADVYEVTFYRHGDWSELMRPCVLLGLRDSHMPKLSLTGATLEDAYAQLKGDDHG